jgi:hypothetical protein
MKIEPRAYTLAANGTLPNNPSCSLLIYPSPGGQVAHDLASYFERLFASKNR